MILIELGPELRDVCVGLIFAWVGLRTLQTIGSWVVLGRSVDRTPKVGDVARRMLDR